MPLCMSHPTAVSFGRNNKVRVFVRSGALFPRTQFVLNASTADGRWRHAPKTASSTRIARNPRHAEAFAGGIDRGTQCAGDQHRNLFAALSSFLDDPASFLSCRVNLEFASSQRSSHGRSSSLHRLRRYPVFAPSDQVLAFVLSNVAPANCFQQT